MIYPRTRFAWYAAAALIGSLLLGSPPGRAAAAGRVGLKATHESQSTKPATRLQPSDDALRHIDRNYFTVLEPHQLAQFHAITVSARTSQPQQPAGFRFRR